MQTCRRHPEAGRFMATCPGCSQEQHDLEARNRAEAQARAALRDLELDMERDEILEVQATATTLIVVTRAPSEYFEFGVDVFRLPTAEECDPELPDWDRRTPGKWVLEMQAGDHVEDAVPKMIADARKYLAEIGLPVPPKPKTPKPAPKPIVLVEFPTRPVLPATQAAATQAADKAADEFWDHAENCEQCLDAQSTSTPGGEHCRTGRPLAQRAEDARLVAEDFKRLDYWHRRGGREAAMANDWIAR